MCGFISKGIFGKYLLLSPLRALLGHLVQKKIFCFNKKIFLQTYKTKNVIACLVRGTPTIEGGVEKQKGKKRF